MKTDYQRLVAYVRSHLRRHHMYPTVREAANALKVRQEAIELAAGEEPLMLTAYHTETPQLLGEHYVEILEG